jgi:hypothetical protein
MVCVGVLQMWYCQKLNEVLTELPIPQVTELYRSQKEGNNDMMNFVRFKKILKQQPIENRNLGGFMKL